MAQRGRKPDPPALKLLKENAKRATSAGPFATLRAAGSPEKPQTIADDPIASAEWDRLVFLLEDRRILSPADAGVLACYASAWSMICRCREELSKSKLTIKNPKNGSTKVNPLCATLESAQRSLVSYASELGLSPTARGRVTTLEDVTKPESKLAAFLE